MTCTFSRLRQRTDLCLEHGIHALMGLLALLERDGPELQLHQVVGQPAWVLWIATYSINIMAVIAGG